MQRQMKQIHLHCIFREFSNTEFSDDVIYMELNYGKINPEQL